MRVLIAIFACALLLAACGGDDDDAKTTGDTTVPAAGTPVTGPQREVLLKAANERCKRAIRDLALLPPLPEDIDADNPGDQLVEFGDFLESSDPNDALERELHQALQVIDSKLGDDTLDPVLAALQEVIDHEVARNQAASQDDLEGYQKEKAAAEAAYEDLAAASKEAGVPACGLGA